MALRPGMVPYAKMKGARRTTLALVLLLHALIVVPWSDERRQPPPARQQLVALRLLAEEPPPPPPPPKIKRPPQKLKNPVTQNAPPAPAKRSPKPRAPQAIHQPDEDEWILPAADPAASATERAGTLVRRAPGGYADAVRTRIVGQVVYPQDALYAAPDGFRGDPRTLRRQCTIAYEIVVDRQGRLVSSELEPCGDELLLPAAKAALLKAQPYPPPPVGAARYRIYGSINFRRPAPPR